MHIKQVHSTQTSLKSCLPGDHASVDTVFSTPDSPQPRVGSASTALAGKVYLFSGRGGVAMAPLEEHGKLWILDELKAEWAHLNPSDPNAPYPEGRSYHAMTSNGVDTIYIHSGCPEKGRLSDLWSFQVDERAWKKLADAPPPSRGGSSIAYSGGRLYRMNGFDGETEQGGSLDTYDPVSNSWTTFPYSPDGQEGPIARSVCSLLAVDVAGQPSLLTLFGESDPSNLGHAGAGKMLSDVWLFDIPLRKWKVVNTTGTLPPPRGWFDADVVSGKSVVISGGLAESNQRLDDIWLLSF